MIITRLRSMRRLIVRCGVLLGFLFLISAADTFVCGHLDHKDAFRALPGTRIPVSGNLYRPVRHPEDVQFRFNDPGLRLTIAEIRGSFWRGELTVPATAAEGVLSPERHYRRGHQSRPCAGLPRNGFLF